MPLGFLSTFSLHAFFLMVGLMHHSLLRVGCFHIQRFWYYRAAGGERWSSSTSDDRNDLTISELLHGNFGRTKNGKLRQGPSIEQTRLLREYNRQENARVPNSAYSHLVMAQNMWREVVESGDVCIDATCGNGHDSAFIAQLLDLTSGQGQLYCMDVQEVALRNTKARILEKVILTDDDQFNNSVHLFQRNHRTFPEEIKENSVKLIVYNLGYLPGGDKNITTRKTDTLQSIIIAITLLKTGGLLSILCYRKHSIEAMEESIEIEKVLSELDPGSFRSFSHAPINWPLAPLLITTYKLPRSNQFGNRAAA